MLPGAVGDPAGDEQRWHGCGCSTPPTAPSTTTLSFFGIGPISWDRRPDWARFSVILVNIWYGAPFFMIMYLRH